MIVNCHRNLTVKIRLDQTKNLWISFFYDAETDRIWILRPWGRGGGIIRQITLNCANHRSVKPPIILRVWYLRISILLVHIDIILLCPILNVPFITIWQRLLLSDIGIIFVFVVIPFVMQTSGANVSSQALRCAYRYFRCEVGGEVLLRPQKWIIIIN